MRRKFLLANVLTAEVKRTRQENKYERQKKILARIVSGKILKKYQCSRTLQVETGISRKNIKAQITNENKQIDFA